MASRYYNPRLASIAGAAQGKPYVSAKPQIDEAFNKLYRSLDIKRAEQIKKQKEIDSQVSRIKYDSDKWLLSQQQKKGNIPEKHKAGFLLSVGSELKKLFKDSNDPKLLAEESQRIKMNAISQLNSIGDSYDKINNAIAPNALLIKENKYDKDLLTEEALDINAKLQNGDWVPKITENGYEQIKLGGSDEFVSTEEILKKAALIPDQSELHSTITKNMIDAAEEFEKSDYPIDVFKSKINNEILSGPLDYKTALSLAGKIGLGGQENIDLKRLALASSDENDYVYEDYEFNEKGEFVKTGKVISGEAGLIERVKDYYRNAAAQYASQFESNRIEKETISTTKSKDSTVENIATAGIEDIEKALTDFNFSILNGKTINGRKVENTEIKNGKLIINYVARTTSEGQQIAESEPIDLNDQMAIKNLTGEYLKSIYGSDKTVDQAILSLRNKEIKTIEKAAQEKSILFPSPTTKPQLP